MILKRRITEAEVISEFLKNEFYQKEYDRDREDEADGDRVHARSAAVPVMRDPLEELVHLVSPARKEFEIVRRPATGSHPGSWAECWSRPPGMQSLAS